MVPQEVCTPASRSGARWRPADGKPARKENVRLGAVLQMMKNRPLHQRALDVAEGILHPREQDISAPDFICAQILPIRFET